MTGQVARLPEVSRADQAAMLSAPRTREALADLLPRLAARDVLEVGGAGTQTELSGKLRVAAWNVERCMFPEKSADLLAKHGVDIVLLSEVDNGMARTKQRNTTADMANALNMQYAYGLEFYEMGLGGPTELAFCSDDTNLLGWHGNAIMSSVPFDAVKLIHLDDGGFWFLTEPGMSGNSDQPRLGGRMAIAALIPTHSGQICFVSTHLESNAQGPYRLAQYRALLDAIDEFAPGCPVLIGGDLNTGNHMPPDYDWQSEDLFEMARQSGYDWDMTPPGVTTRPSLITPHPTRQMKLDWFCSRDLNGSALPLVPALDLDGSPLSDHECILCDIQL
ncbi:MAG: endonuclease/exonuclease/phosphatase family protein [Paracoccaceae bacterium]